jgi:hypothetical protein
MQTLHNVAISRLELVEGDKGKLLSGHSTCDLIVPDLFAKRKLEAIN